MMLKVPTYANEEALSECEYGVNQGQERCEPLGYGSSKAASSTISASMIGWGLGLAIAIAVVAGVVHSSTSAHSSSSS